jgi:hypothetical protein
MISRRIGTLAVGCLLCTGTLIASIAAALPAATPAASDRTVGQIAQERLNVATKGYDYARANFDHGFSDSSRLVEWIWRRAAAARDLPDAAKRTAILQDSVQQIKNHLAAVEQASKAGVASPDEIFIAQDRALECELWLAKSQETR